MTQRIKIQKVEELKDARHPNNIPVGNSYEGVCINKPKVGESLYVDLGDGRTFNTSVIQEILADGTLVTMNSKYIITPITLITPNR